MSEERVYTPPTEDTFNAMQQTASLRNEIVDTLKRDDVSINVGILAILSLAEQIRARMTEEERLQADLAARAFNALDSFEKMTQAACVAGEN
ncbi:hypothetical protein [Methanolobus sp. WCC5]|uniref:hypothetical protein n=1 Tax=Methanolobus sp. WCC5 TaxID=3125785 RepID=UPI00324A3930